MLHTCLASFPQFPQKLPSLASQIKLHIVQRRVQFWHSGLLFKQHDTLLKIETNRLYKTITCTGCIFPIFLNLCFQTPHMNIQYLKRCCFFPPDGHEDKQICLIIPFFGSMLNNQTVLWNTSTHPHFFCLSKAVPFWQVTGHVCSVSKRKYQKVGETQILQIFVSYDIF